MNMSTKNIFAHKQKGAVVTLCVLCSLFFVAFGCGKQNDNPCEEEYSLQEEYSLLSADESVALNCATRSFMEGVFEYKKKCNTYVIKGIVLNEYEYGAKIELIEDLKGNFPKNVNTFIVWGHHPHVAHFRTDVIPDYPGEVLFMHLARSLPIEYKLPPGFTWIEKPEDFCTLICTSSVIRLFGDGSDVFGHITDNHIIMPLNTFEKSLKTLLKNKK